MFKKIVLTIIILFAVAGSQAASAAHHPGQSMPHVTRLPHLATNRVQQLFHASAGFRSISEGSQANTISRTTFIQHMQTHSQTFTAIQFPMIDQSYNTSISGN